MKMKFCKKCYIGFLHIYSNGYLSNTKLYTYLSYCFWSLSIRFAEGLKHWKWYSNFLKEFRHDVVSMLSNNSVSTLYINDNVFYICVPRPAVFLQNAHFAGSRQNRKFTFNYTTSFSSYFTPQKWCFQISMLTPHIIEYLYWYNCLNGMRVSKKVSEFEKSFYLRDLYRIL